MDIQGIDDDLDILILYWYRNPRVEARRRRLWVHDIYRRRRQYGEYYHLVQELQLDGEMFHEYFRVTREQFRQLLTLVEPEIAKEETRLRETICPRQRLAITMRCDIIQCVIF